MNKQRSSWLFLLLFFAGIASVNGQQVTDPYEKNWRQIDSLITTAGLPESALAEVDKIYAKTKKEGDSILVIKSLLYKSLIAELRTDTGLLEAIRSFELETNVSTGATRALLFNLTAELYWKYLQQVRWKIYNRTATQVRNEHPSSWSIDDFHKVITDLYLRSLTEQSLKLIPVNQFEPIIIPGNQRRVRPTLYDLLVNRAILYFEHNERSVNKPSDQFELDQERYFGQAKAFVNQDLSATDSAEGKFTALKLYQQLIRFHINRNDTYALLDADLNRFQFVYRNAVLDNKDSLYIDALQQLITATPEKYNTSARVQLAKMFMQLGSAYEPMSDTANRYALSKARTLLMSIPKDTADFASNESAVLMSQIERRMLSMQVEGVNLPQKPFRMFIQYRNLSTVYIRVLRLSARQVVSYQDHYWSDSIWRAALSLPVAHEFAQLLPQTNDYQAHSVEIKVDALPTGRYFIVASSSPDFELEGGHATALINTQVSAISAISNDTDHFVLHRETGQPLNKVRVKEWIVADSAPGNANRAMEGRSFVTNRNGYVKIPQDKDHSGRQGFYLFISDADTLTSERPVYHTYEDVTKAPAEKDAEAYEEEHLKTFYFTDRGIYRPGQTVHFKGILTTRDFKTRKVKVIPNRENEVYLYDANNKLIDSILVTTNEFGSFSGKFGLPSTGLTGTFTISDLESFDEVEFQVEEYKRPTFAVELLKAQQSYALGDSVTARGELRSFAGNTLNNARITYRVVREVQPFYPRPLSRKSFPYKEPQEIKHGTVEADSKGNFSFGFPALPDESIDREADPVFHFKIYVDVTSQSGETRSAETSFTIGYKLLRLVMNVPSQNLPADSLKSFTVKAEDLDGNLRSANIETSVFALKSPQRLIRERLWPQPDQYIFSQSEYITLFPNDEYASESKPENWELGNLVMSRNDSISSYQTISLANHQFSPGWYLIRVAARDRKGQEVLETRYVQLFDSKTGRPASPTYNWGKSIHIVTTPGKTEDIVSGSSAENVFLIKAYKALDTEDVPRDYPTTYSFSKLSNEQIRESRKISISDGHGHTISWVFVKHNRVFVTHTTLEVNTVNPELKMVYSSFRDRLEPGKKETFGIRISGTDADQKAAEVITAMYDASLDEMHKHSWNLPNLSERRMPALLYWRTNSFETRYSHNKQWYDEHGLVAQKIYDYIGILKYGQTNIMRDGLIATTLKGRVPGVVAESDVVVTGYGVTKRAATSSVSSIRIRGTSTLTQYQDLLTIVDGKILSGSIDSIDPDDIASISFMESGEAQQLYGEAGTKGAVIVTTKNVAPEKQTVRLRKDFRETAFFFPTLRTDSSGAVSFNFEVPEALTQWKWMSFAHTRDLTTGYSEKLIVTQKQLMVRPNAPRFVREGDRIDFSASIANISGKELTGQVQLLLIDPETNASVDGWFRNVFPNQYFTVPAGQTVPVSFSLEIPFEYARPVVYRLVAQSDSLSDGEEAFLPVISNRILLTETLPLPMKDSAVRSFRLDKLLRSDSETRTNHRLTAEFSTNPTWYAVLSLPYLAEKKCECIDDIFNRYYANSLASLIVASVPDIANFLGAIADSDTSKKISQLASNESLKNILLNETPWVLEASTGEEKLRNLGRLLDENNVAPELGRTLAQLSELQLANGAFTWFKGGQPDVYTTQRIIIGIGQLFRLGAVPNDQSDTLLSIATRAIAYLDNKVATDYSSAANRKGGSLPGLSTTMIHYLYMRSFFTDLAVPGPTFTAYNHYRKLSQKEWVKQNAYLKGMIALSLFRTGDVQTAINILRSLKEFAVKDPEIGMYWQNNSPGYFWHQSDIEAQALLIEAFGEITKDTRAVNEMRTFLLRNRQTNGWKTGRATADACYALLLQGTDWLKASPKVEISLGERVFRSSDNTQENPFGYFSVTLPGDKVDSSHGRIKVAVMNADTATGRASWGAVYWQYFENIENITEASTPLQLKKQLFIRKNTDRGPVLESVNEGQIINVGDRLSVRIELRVDRDMEYVHLKDLRASALEPTNVISGFKWQGGLGYYESTRDASTSFFFDRLPRGSYVFEYDLYVTHSGTFNNGVATVECYYAPEYKSHSRSLRLNIEQPGME